MKDWWNKRYASISMYAFFVIAASVLFIFGVLNFPWFLSLCWKFIDVIKSFIIGFVIAYLLNPGYRFFREKVYGKLFSKKPMPRVTKTLSIITMYLITLGILTFLLWIVIPQFIFSVTRLIENSSDYYNRFNVWITDLTASDTYIKNFANELSSKTMDYIKNIDIKTISQIKDITLSVTSGIFAFFVGIIVSIYMLYNKEKFCAQAKKIGYAIFSKKFMYKIQRLFGTSHITFGKYLTGVALDALIVGVACFIAMQLAGVPYAVLIGVMVGITNMIPFFGPFIGGVPSILLVLMVNPSKAIWCMVILVILQQVDGNFIAPKIMGQKTGISAVWVIFAILIGGGFFGVLGMLIGVPVFSVIYIFVKRIINQRLENKFMSPVTNDYLSTAEVSDKYIKSDKQ